MPKNRAGLDAHSDLVPHFATRAEIAELREKIMSLQTIVRALAERQGADPAALEEWALCMTQFDSTPGRALATAQRAALTFGRGPGSLAPAGEFVVPQRPNDAA